MTRYEQGFMNKCAEYGVDGRVFLEKTAKSRALARLISRLSPKVVDKVYSAADAIPRPSLLQRLFTKPKFRALFDNISRTAGTGGYGGYGEVLQPDILRDANPSGVRYIRRLAPGRIAAAVGGTAGLAGITADLLSSSPSSPSSPAPNVSPSGISAKHLLAALGLAGGVGAGAAGISMAKKKRKSGKGGKDAKDDKGDDDQK